MKASHFSPDIQDFIQILARYRVRYVIVGGEAVIYHGFARLTGDVDFFYECSPDNAHLLFQALSEFWNGNIPGIDSEKEFLSEGVIIQFGVPPNRIDLINKIDGVCFKEAWENRKTEYMEVSGNNVTVYFIGLEELIKNKEAARRLKDLEDLKYLKAAKNRISN